MMHTVLVPVIVAALNGAVIEVESVLCTSNEVSGYELKTLSAYNRLVTAGEARLIDCRKNETVHS